MLLSSAGLAQAQTDCPYWPMTPGSSITYQVSNITGHFDRPSWQLQQCSRVPNTVQPIQTITCSASSNIQSGMPELFEESQAPGVTPSGSPPANMTGCLVEGEFAPTGIWYLGEYTNFQQLLIVPGEAKLPVSPVGGEHIDCISNVIQGGAVVYQDHWTYQTIGHFAQLEQFTDCWWTCLIEYSAAGAIQTVYNYVFARGIGMIQFWYIKPDGNGNGAGYFFNACSWQGQ